MNFQRVEVVPARQIGPRRRGIPAGIHPHRTNELVRHQALERPVPVPQIHVVQIRLRWILEPLHCIEILRLGHVHRPQHQSIQNAEYHGICANPQRQGGNRRQGKTRRLAQLPECEFQIAEHDYLLVREFRVKSSPKGSGPFD